MQRKKMPVKLFATCATFLPVAILFFPPSLFAFVRGPHPKDRAFLRRGECPNGDSRRQTPFGTFGPKNVFSSPKIFLKVVEKAIKSYHQSICNP